MTSAYPLSDDVLTDRVRDLAVELGAWPSQRRVMRSCRVGAPRADAALSALRDAGFDPTTPTPTPAALSVVPDLDESGPERTPEPAEQDSDTQARGAPDAPAPAVSAPAEIDQDALVNEAVATPTRTRRPRVPRWPLLIIALGAFVSIWGGWVGLGEMAGFGPVRLLPGISDWTINSAITLPLGVEAYAGFAMWTWLAPPDAQVSTRARRFACWSSIAALGLGVFGQAAYHLLVTAGVQTAPWPIVVFVSCLPVLVLGAGAALAHLIHHTEGVTR